MDGPLNYHVCALSLATPTILAGVVGLLVGACLTALFHALFRRKAITTVPAPHLAEPNPDPTFETEPERQERADIRSPTEMREPVGALAGGVAHDFHNLLTVILAHVDRASSRLPMEHDARDILGDVLAPVREAAGLTRALLRLSQDPTGECVALDFVALTRDSVRLLRRLLPASVTLTDETPDAPLWIQDDPTRIQRLLVDLVIQARDATPDRTPIRLELIHDATGDGLGDAVLRVADARGRHDRRVVRFPIRSAPDDDSTTRARVPAARGSGEMILVAEDDEFVREILVSALEDAGYRVCAAVDGPSALEIAELERDELCLAVLDVDLPGRSGPRVRDDLRMSAPNLPILFVTGGGFSDETRVAGGEAVLQKPFSMDQFIRATHDILHPSHQDITERA